MLSIDVEGLDDKEFRSISDYYEYNIINVVSPSQVTKAVYLEAKPKYIDALETIKNNMNDIIKFHHRMKRELARRVMKLADEIIQKESKALEGYE